MVMARHGHISWLLTLLSRLEALGAIAVLLCSPSRISTQCTSVFQEWPCWRMALDWIDPRRQAEISGFHSNVPHYSCHACRRLKIHPSPLLGHDFNRHNHGYLLPDKSSTNMCSPGVVIDLIRAGPCSIFPLWPRAPLSRRLPDAAQEPHRNHVTFLAHSDPECWVKMVKLQVKCGWTTCSLLPDGFGEVDWLFVWNPFGASQQSSHRARSTQIPAPASTKTPDKSQTCVRRTRWCFCRKTWSIHHCKPQAP